MEEINVVYSTDAKYIVPTLVSMKSILLNNKSDCFYKFILLTKNPLGNEYKRYFSVLESLSCKVFYKEIGTIFDGFNEDNQFTQACYYRLTLPYILNDVDKCIYLDGDTVVMNELKQFYEEDINGYYLGACKDAMITWNALEEKKYAEKLGLDNLDCYINSGVLLFNLKKMREDNIFSRFKLEMDNTYKYKFYDQDILNATLQGNIRVLAPKYNCFPYYFSKRKIHIQKILSRYSMQEIDNAIKLPVVLHYASAEKPWNSAHVKNRNHWISVAKSFDNETKEELIFPYIKEQTKLYEIKNGRYLVRQLKKILCKIEKR